jgi:hypothetical protein
MVPGPIRKLRESADVKDIVHGLMVVGEGRKNRRAPGREEKRSEEWEAIDFKKF